MKSQKVVEFAPRDFVFRRSCRTKNELRSAPVQTQSVLTQMEAETSSRNLLEHSFYKRWLAGELTKSELSNYAAQYYHVVAALPRWLETAATQHPTHRETLLAHAAEESAHVRLWERFAGACGIALDALRSSKPNKATATMLSDCDVASDAGNAAAVAWALEVQTPAVSKEKLRGLEQFYGIDARSGGEYFALHEQLDVEHAAELERVIASQEPSDAASAPTAAFIAADGLWKILTSVEHAA
jgi:pyrroloquinoline-quinone synthase